MPIKGGMKDVKPFEVVIKKQNYSRFLSLLFERVKQIITSSHVCVCLRPHFSCIATGSLASPS